MAAATEVPGRFDLVLNAEGYRFADYEQRRAVYTYSPTFVTRQNVQGAYGDNFQDFWLTFSQNDWSLGEQQKFYRQDAEQSRRYWRGEKIDVLTVGQVGLRQDVSALTFAEAVKTCATAPNRDANRVYLGGTLNLRSVDEAGTLTDHGAHGLGAAPSQFGMTSDGTDIYLSTTDAGTVGVRKWNGAAFSTFSATASDCLEYLNNALYGVVNTSGVLQRYDTAGAASTLYTWQQADGGGLGTSFKRLRAFGGKLIILLRGARAWELWMYDGTAPSKIDEFQGNFEAEDVEVTNGTVFVSGYYVRADAKRQRTVRYWANGTPGELWRSPAYTTDDYAPGLTTWDGRLVFQDDAIPGTGNVGTFLMYDPVNGGVHSFAQFANSNVGNWRLLASTPQLLVMVKGNTQGALFPSSAAVSTGTLTTSLVDFDSSLPKRIKSVKVDFDSGTDGNGGTVDISYRVNDLDSTYTSVQTGATSGTEYAIGVAGRSVSIRVTLNKGTSTNGPVLKRIYVRAAPIQDTFKRRTYILDLSGRDGESHILLRDGSEHPKDGLAMATDLNTAAVATTPFSITDRFGTFTGLVEPERFEVHEIRPEEFVAVVGVREV